MRKMLKLGALILIAALVFFGVMSCKPGVTIAVRSLKGETILYITDGNGLDYVTYTFNDDATGGEWETGEYTFDYPDQAAADSGKYTDKEWFMTWGQKGTFTYDEETGRTTSVMTHVWRLKEGEPGPPPGYKDQYDWATYTEDTLGFGQPAADSATWTQEADSFFNNDNPELIGFIDQGDDSNQWRYYEKTTETETVDGSTTEVVTEETTTYTITENEVVRDVTIVETETVDGGTPAKDTERFISTWKVNKFFLGGEETGDTAFDKVWKEGNEVTFMLERTKYEYIQYEGNTEPSPPSSIDETTGEGTNSGATYEYFVSLTGEIRLEWAFRHAGDAIFETSEFEFSERGLE